MSLEKYPAEGEIAKDPVFGNLYTARNLQEALRGGEQVRTEYQETLRKLHNNKVHSIIALKELIIEDSVGASDLVEAFIYVPNLRHSREAGVSRLTRRIIIFDDSGNCEVTVHKNVTAPLTELKNDWYSDVILLGVYHPDASSFSLTHYLHGHVPITEIRQRVLYPKKP
ncbi:hypothetical protein HYS94_00755 [Candidatus Daviesbacteria bacterium]|nr:hypothetical protein [Candidatus Daviesbacteria bacterium]